MIKYFVVCTLFLSAMCAPFESATTEHHIGHDLPTKTSLSRPSPINPEEHHIGDNLPTKTLLSRPSPINPDVTSDPLPTDFVKIVKDHNSEKYSSTTKLVNDAKSESGSETSHKQNKRENSANNSHGDGQFQTSHSIPENLLPKQDHQKETIHQAPKRVEAPVASSLDQQKHETSPHKRDISNKDTTTEKSQLSNPTIAEPKIATKSNLEVIKVDHISEDVIAPHKREVTIDDHTQSSHRHEEDALNKGPSFVHPIPVDQIIKNKQTVPITNHSSTSSAITSNIEDTSNNTTEKSI